MKVDIKIHTVPDTWKKNFCWEMISGIFHLKRVLLRCVIIAVGNLCKVRFLISAFLQCKQINHHDKMDRYNYQTVICLLDQYVFTDFAPK